MPVHVALVVPSGPSVHGSNLPATISKPAQKQYISSAATSTKTTISASGPQSVWEVSVIGADVWMKAGDDPTASAGDDRYLDVGKHHFTAQAAGEKLAFLDA